MGQFAHWFWKTPIDIIKISYFNIAVPIDISKIMQKCSISPIFVQA